MNHDEVWRTIDAERLSMADLFDDLSEAEWQTPSLCAGWRVRDVAAHLTLAHTGLLAGTVALVRARGGPNRMIRDSAVRQARLPVERYPVALRGMVGSRRTAPFLTPFEPLVDVLVHGQDIAVPLGRTRPMPTAAAATAATRFWPRGWPWYAERNMRGLRLVATDHAWSVGEGRLVEGPMAALLLLITGRAAALPLLSGPGVPEFETRLSYGGPGELRQRPAR